MKLLKSLMLPLSCAFALRSTAAAPDGASVDWNDGDKSATITLPPGDFTIDADLWLTDSMSGVSNLWINGNGASVTFSGASSSYASGLAKLATDAVIHAGSGVTFVADLDSVAGKGFFSTRSDIGMDFVGGGLVFNPSAGASRMLYTGAGGITLAGAGIRDGRLGAHAPGVYADRTEGLDGSLRVDGTVFVKASATPSVISSPLLMVSAGTVFDIESGATLRIEAPATDERRTSDSSRYWGGFCKLGGGELALASDCELTGRVTVKDGVLRLGPGVRASAADWEIYDGAKVVLSDGSLLGGSGIRTVPAVMRRAQVHLDASLFNGGDGDAARNHLFTIRNTGSSGGVFSQFNNSRMSFVTDGFADGKPALLFNQQPYVLEGFKNTSRDVTVFMVRRNFQPYRSPFNFVNMSCLRENPSLTRQTDGFFNSASFGVSHGSDTQNLVYLWSAKSSSGSNVLHNKDFQSSAASQKDPLIEMFAQWGGDDGKSDLLVRQFSSSADNLVTTDAQTIDTSAYPGNALNHDYLAIGMRVYSSDPTYRLQADGVNDGNYGDQNFNLAEFIAFFERPSEDELTEITDYLRAKWFGSETASSSPLAVEIESGATASIDGGPARAVAKTGGGTLRVASVGAAAEESLAVESGALVFGPGTLAAKAAVWIDASDDGTLTRGGNGKVGAIANKGTLGGSFFSKNADHWSDVATGTDYSSSSPLRMLQFAGSTAFDLVAPVFTEASEDPLTVFLVMAVDSNYIDEWRRVLSFTSPTNEVAGTSAKPPEMMDLMLSSAANVSGGKPFAYQVTTEGTSGYVVDRSVYSASSWTDGSDYNRPVLLVIEDYPAQFNYSLENADDGGKSNENPSASARHGHRYGLVRLGATAVAGGGSSACFRGGIGEMVVFNKPLTAEEKTSVRDYLAARWFDGNEEASAPAAMVGGTETGLSAKADLALGDGVTVRPGGQGAVEVGALSLVRNAVVPIEVESLPGDGTGMYIFRYDSYRANGGKFVIDLEAFPAWRVRTHSPFVSIEKHCGLLLIVR